MKRGARSPRLSRRVRDRMSHLGILLLREILSARPGTLCDRVFAHGPTTRSISAPPGCRSPRSNRGDPPGRSTSSGSPCATNSPIRTSSRCSTFPGSRSCRRPVGGAPPRGGRGVCTLNPAPVAPFFDALLVGDGEEAVLEIVALVEERKRAAGPRRISYRGSPGSRGVRPGVSRGVKRRVLADLNRSPLLPAPILPAMRVVHDRLSVEISGGAREGAASARRDTPIGRCGSATLSSFCGTSRRRRQKRDTTRWGSCRCPPPTTAAQTGSSRRRWKRSPIERFALPPLASPGRVAGEHGAADPEGSQVGLHARPGSGTERLRRSVNKEIPDDDVLKTAEWIFGTAGRPSSSTSWSACPERRRTTSGRSDAGRPGRAIARRHGKRASVTVSVSAFVPKPHTPSSGSARSDARRSRSGSACSGTRSGGTATRR